MEKYYWRDIKRRESNTIKVGSLTVGGDSPISVQSMTNTKTSDADKTIKQVKELTARVEACEGKSEGKPKRKKVERKPSAYAEFVKANYAKVKNENLALTKSLLLLLRK